MYYDKIGNPTGIGLDGHYPAHFPVNRWADSVVIAERMSGSATQDRVNIATAIANAKARAYGSGMMAPLHFIPGRYFVDEPIELSNVIPDLDFHGSTVEWRGDPDLDVFNCEHAREGHIRNLTVVATSSYPARSGFRWWRSNAGGMTLSPSKMKWENVRIYGYPDAFEYGWLVGGPGSVDQNVDYGEWVRCSAQYYSDSGWYLGGTQGYGHVCDTCWAESNGAGDYGVFASYAYFTWLHGGMNANKVADFRIKTWGYKPYVIEDYTSEGSDRTIVIEPSPRCTVRVKDVRVAANNANADGKMIVVQDTTALNMAIQDSNFGDGKDDPEGPFLPIQFDFEGASSNGRIVLENVDVVSENAPNPPWGSRAPNRSEGVKLVNEVAGTFTQVTDIVP